MHTPPITSTITYYDTFAVYATVLTLDFIKIFIGCVIFKKGLWISNVVA